MNLRKLSRDEKGYKNLDAVAKLLEASSANGYHYWVDDCYFDYGQDWWWSTILCRGNYGNHGIDSWQVLSPREWELVVGADGLDDLVNAVKDIVSDKYFLDKEEK